MNIFRGRREYAFEMSHALFMELCDSELNQKIYGREVEPCLLYTSPSPRD